MDSSPNLGVPPYIIPAYFGMAATHLRNDGELIWHIQNKEGKYIPRHLTAACAFELLKDKVKDVQVDLIRAVNEVLILDVAHFQTKCMPGENTITWSMDILFRPVLKKNALRRNLFDLRGADFIHIDLYKSSSEAVYRFAPFGMDGYWHEFYGGFYFGMNVLLKTINRLVKYSKAADSLHPIVIPKRVPLPILTYPIVLDHINNNGQKCGTSMAQFLRQPTE